MAKRKEPSLDNVFSPEIENQGEQWAGNAAELKDDPSFIIGMVKESVPPAEKITCMARTVECFENQGFRNMRVVTLFIEDGVVVRVKRSDAWQAFELIAKLDVANHMDVLYLNGQWVDKKTMSERPNALPNEIMF